MIAFKERYPTTFCIVDASDISIKTPSDLFLQSCTWSNYKHHNTAKLLIGCTPNGAISYVSFSVSSTELTDALAIPSSGNPAYLYHKYPKATPLSL